MEVFSMERTFGVTYKVIFETQPDGSSKPKIIIQYEHLPGNLEHGRKHNELVQKLIDELGIPDVEIVYPTQPPPTPITIPIPTPTPTPTPTPIPTDTNTP
jgi:hypothetical protein